MNNILNPSFLLLLGGFALPLFPKKIRSATFLLVSLISLILVWNLPDGTFLHFRLLNYELILLKIDALSKIFATIFALITFLGGIYAYHLKDSFQQVAALIYSASSIGVTFAGDWITLFMYWELMAISSVVLIWSQRDGKSSRAGFRYLFVHIFGGSVLLAGIILHISSENTTLVYALTSMDSLANWLILLGIGLNAAILPLNAWLPDAYPKATITGSVFLSALTTKTAVYVLARVFSGWEILLILGTMMTVFGVIYALLTNDIRELLAYHIISQVGYMVAGVGIGTDLSVNGSTAHAYSHILYKALLFMGAGVIIYSTGTSKLNKLGGLYKLLPVTLILYLIGGFSISSVPLFNGFISKSIIVHSALEKAVEDNSILLIWCVILMNIAMIGTFLSTTLKLPYYVWFSKKSPDEQLEHNPVPFNMHLAMALTGIICIIYGIKPTLLYAYLPFEMDYNPFAITHLAETLEILLMTFVVFWIFRSKLSPKPKIILDFDWFYRRPKKYIETVFVNRMVSIFDFTDQVLRKLIDVSISYFRNPIRILTNILFTRVEAKEYDPDDYRLSTNMIISLILLVFVGILLLNL